MAGTSKNKSFRSNSKNIIYNVIKACDEEERIGRLTIPVTQASKRASMLTGIGLSSVYNIRKQANGEKNPDFSSPQKKLKRETVACVKMDSFDVDLLRRTVRDFYVLEKKVPTINKLLPVLKEKMNFAWQRETLRKILREIGFTWKKTQNKRKILMERSDIILARTKFLRSIKQYREENRPLIYIDETWIDSNLTFGKCWQSSEIFGVVETGNASRRIIVLCAGGEMGFLPNTNLLYKANTSTGDYHGQMNATIFEKWAQEKLIPNLPSNSVIIIDNAPYHSIQLNKPPNSSHRKELIMDWLSRNNISFCSSSRKVELLDIVKQNTPKIKTYKFDCMIEEYGHSVLRLPPYQCDMNAIEYVWAELKNYVRSHNVTGDISMSNLLSISENAISSISLENWKKYCQHAANLEREYWDKDGIIEELCDPVCFSVNPDSETESDSEFSSD